MKKDTHPTIFQADVVCSGCSETWKTLSTREKIAVEICSSCHPAWTGEQRIVDTEGRVDRMKRRYNLQ
ncbi:50S ribosomal protein L31 [Chloroflexi bacterium]|jgi:large subunit ribosomal protein L31|nr:50S ribosomal protein L31 [Chloroflexota bacterium]MBP06203.1 50S ribosomal protein L31 [Chloroflexota bacterium]MDC0252916.1 50S ribosomal protein L31 [Chloroflexota bacterium]OUW95496.1 MAG: 50S ribosomal protein L31 [Chloroflexi bacterium TMED230]RZP13596.1 MAG: 50S ribosomal protein L31 [Chloroflexota bacterium]|tara:strand:+ start:2469 stop:2672 length:204 start_codon:yes stop_codon:yes gene_type:complete